MKLGRVTGLLAAGLMMGLFLAGVAPAGDENFRSVTDSRGVQVKVPREINRVITISDGLVEGTMTVLGQQGKIVALGAASLQKGYTYKYPVLGQKEPVLQYGINTVTSLNPKFMDLPRIADWNAAPNYEAIAGLKPDVMIVRVGSCWHYRDNDQVPKSIKMLESLGIPLVVLHSPNTYGRPDMAVISSEIRIIGRVFGQEDRADRLAKYLESQIALVSERTKDVPESARTKVLIFGLSPKDREKGGAGNAAGLETIESYFVEEVANARNAFPEKGGSKMLSAEQVLALNPEVIVLRTSWGYHPPRELYEAPYYQNLSELKAVKERRVAALPYTPSNCDKRLEYPIDAMVIAKAAYPKKFQDIDLAAWLIEFYRNVYGVDEATAAKLRSAQCLDWTLDK